SGSTPPNQPLETAAATAISADGGLKTMFLTQLKTAAAMVLLAIGILGSGAGPLVHHVLADKPEAAPAKETPKDLPPLIRSAQSGLWSAPATWEGGKL